MITRKRQLHVIEKLRLNKGVKSAILLLDFYLRMREETNRQANREVKNRNGKNQKHKRAIQISKETQTGCSSLPEQKKKKPHKQIDN